MLFSSLGSDRHGKQGDLFRRPNQNGRLIRTSSCPPPLFGGSFLEKVLTRLCLFVSLVLMNESQVRKARKQLLGELAEIVRGSLLARRIFHRRGCLRLRRREGDRLGGR